MSKNDNERLAYIKVEHNPKYLLQLTQYKNGKLRIFFTCYIQPSIAIPPSKAITWRSNPFSAPKRASRQSVTKLYFFCVTHRWGARLCHPEHSSTAGRSLRSHPAGRPRAGFGFLEPPRHRFPPPPPHPGTRRKRTGRRLDRSWRHGEACWRQLGCDVDRLSSQPSSPLLSCPVPSPRRGCPPFSPLRPAKAVLCAPARPERYGAAAAVFWLPHHAVADLLWKLVRPTACPSPAVPCEEAAQPRRAPPQPDPARPGPPRPPARLHFLTEPHKATRPEEAPSPPSPAAPPLLFSSRPGAFCGWLPSLTAGRGRGSRRRRRRRGAQPRRAAISSSQPLRSAGRGPLLPRYHRHRHGGQPPPRAPTAPRFAHGSRRTRALAGSASRRGAGREKRRARSGTSSSRSSPVHRALGSTETLPHKFPVPSAPAPQIIRPLSSRTPGGSVRRPVLLSRKALRG
ncbi:translation initiation factor IF-2-like [Cygnus olor]|uniref:translation initiation factor IF-2-like n=1 Tax=Cygnus olor TaxID=8869 RepID=UPI001ADE51A5|nr:translation initiation factor IF-2-like [Cygnus olor]